MCMPMFLDFEASSLSSDSYPIEIAWSDGSGQIQSYLISPVTIPEWTDWSEESAQIHGITKQQLVDEGHTPDDVVQKFLPFLRESVIYTDAVAYDEFWLRRLLAVSELDSIATNLEEMDQLIYKLISARTPNLKRDWFIEYCNKMKQQARKMVPGIHRAGWDVQYLIELYKLARVASI